MSALSRQVLAAEIAREHVRWAERMGISSEAVLESIGRPAVPATRELLIYIIASEWLALGDDST